MADTTQRTTIPLHFRGAADAGAPRLAGLPGVHRVEPRPRQVIEIERHDTDDHRLAAAHITLAVHRDGEDPDPHAEWVVDLPDGTGTERLRVPVDGDAVPDQVDELVRGAPRGRPLVPVGRVRTVRHASDLYDTDDRLLARVTRDDISLATFGRSTDVRAWTEARVEPLEDIPGLAGEISRRLADDGLAPGAPSAAAELDRLLRPETRRGPVGPKGSAGAVLMDYVAAQIDRIAAEDLRVRRDEPDSVHQMRVASRRLRSALQAFRPLLDRSRTEPIIEELRALGQSLAPARDAEVLNARISAELQGLDDHLRMGNVQALTTRHFARTEAEARAAVLTTLDGERYAALRTALDGLLENPPLRGRSARRKATKELPKRIGRTATRLERSMRAAIDEQQPDAERDAAVHSARKAGKRLRYATEVVRPAVGKPAKQFAKQLKGLQTALGEHQDTVVARQALRELGAAAHADRDNGFSFGLLHARDAARAEQIERDLPSLFAQAWGKKARCWIG